MCQALRPEKVKELFKGANFSRITSRDYYFSYFTLYYTYKEGMECL